MLSLQGMLGIKSYKTVWTMSHKIRKAMADRDERNQLTGVVETLRAALGSSRKSSTAEAPNSKSTIVVSVEDRGDSPGLAAMRHVPPTAQVQTDRCEGEESILAQKAPDDAKDGKYKKDICDAYDEVNTFLISERKQKRVRWARILMANLTGNIRGVHHGVSEKHLHRYMAEFLYRFNRRAWSAQLLNRALVACVSASTITFAELNS